jgi:MATE family multidrug resistance protein
MTVTSDNERRDRLRPGEGGLPDRIGVREVHTLAWPILVSMLSYTAMGVVDTLFVGQLGKGPLAAVGMGAVTLFTVHAFGNGLLGGLKVAVAQSMGAGDEGLTRTLAWQGLWLALLCGVAEASLSPLAGPLFEALNASEAVAPHAAAYFSARVLGAPFAFGLWALASFFQGRGDTRTPMVANLIANGVNIALDPLLIFGAGPVPALGIAGAGWATVAGFAAGFAFMVWRAGPTLVDAARRPSRALLRRVWFLGAPIGMRASLEIGSFTAFTAILASVGDADLAAHVIVVRIISVSFLPGYGVGEAASVLVGQAVGAGRHELARQAYRASVLLGVGVMGACGALFIFAPGPLLAAFDPTPDVLAIGRDLLLIGAAFQLFDAVAMVTQGALNGAGDSRFVMLSGVATAWIVKVPLGWALAVPVGLGAPGAWLGLTAEIIVIAAISTWRVRGGRWLKAPAPAAAGAQAAAEPAPPGTVAAA